jgi:hypothetical protein|tara:strand:- start:5 stop:136 length:132 start_codon:yes stop_codon:yes gene_type:complete
MCIVELEFLLYSYFEVGGTFSMYHRKPIFYNTLKKIKKITFGV